MSSFISTIEKITDLKKQIEDLEKTLIIKEYPICILNQSNIDICIGNEFHRDALIKPLESITVIVTFNGHSVGVRFNVIVPNVDNVIDVTIILPIELFTSLNSLIIQKGYMMFNNFVLGTFSDQICYIDNKYTLKEINEMYHFVKFQLLTPNLHACSLVNPMGFTIKSNIRFDVMDRKTLVLLGYINPECKKKIYHMYLILSTNCFTLDINLHSDIEIICDDNDILINGKSVLSDDNYKIGIEKGKSKYLTYTYK